MSTPLPLTISVVVHSIITIILIVLLWKKDETIFRKIIWSLIIAIPLLGPLSYGALFNPLANKGGNRSGNKLSPGITHLNNR